MKCQKCEKNATFHITELSGGKPEELHLCEDHAREYLTSTDGGSTEEPSLSSLAGALAQQMQVGQTAEELSRLDQRTCPVCGISFFDFRNKGRLGCPHDYVFFGKDLEPLLLNIHGETEHAGKRPRHSPHDTDFKTELIRLRRDMKAAASEENYERASKLRDEIRRIEERE